MAAPTLIEVSIDRTEYSRYEPGKDTITASIVATGGGTYTNEEITVELVKARRARDAVVARATITLNGVEPQSEDVTFYLPNIVDQDLISLIRFGKYFIRATSVTDDSIIGESPDFDLRVITVEKFRENYLFGIRAIATDIRYPKMQPQSITGVEIIEVSKGALSGFGTLTYVYNSTPTVSRTLSWKGGPPVAITKAGTYTLRAGAVGPGGCAGGGIGEYIVVRIKSLALLPTSTIMEDILIEEKNISDSTLADFINQAISWVENQVIYSHIEPTNLVTEKDATAIQFADTTNSNALYLDTDWDEIVGALTYFPPKTGTWVSIYTPYPNLIRIDSLFGALGHTRVLDVDLDWVQFYPQGGLIQLVPYNSTIAFTYMGLIWNGTLNKLAELPNFWHFNIIEGLKDCPLDLMELIARKAAISALTVIGAALRPGMGSVSLSRDGVSESVSYTNSKYGNFSGPIQVYTDYIEKELPRIKAAYRGAIVRIM